MPESAKLTWYPLAANFPAGLDSDSNPADLKDGMTPDAYGMGIGQAGLLYRDVIPIGAAPIKKTYTIATNIWTWFYKRLWRVVLANLEYNSPEYTAAILYQDIGKLSFDEDAQPIVTFFPALRDSLFVGKSTGGYIVSNADSAGGRFQHGNIEPAMAITTDGNGLSMNQVAYVSNVNGLQAWDGQTVKNITKNMTSALTPFQNKTLTQDIQSRYIIGADSFVYDVEADKLFRYDGSGFRFTTRTLATPRDEPIAVKAVGFVVRNPNGTEGSITYQLKGDENAWRNDNVVKVTYTAGKPYQSFIIHHPDNAPSSSRRFALRIVDMTAGIYIESIKIETNFEMMEESFVHGQ